MHGSPSKYSAKYLRKYIDFVINIYSERRIIRNVLNVIYLEPSMMIYNKPHMAKYAISPATVTSSNWLQSPIKFFRVTIAINRVISNSPIAL